MGNLAEEHNRKSRNWRCAGIVFMVLGILAAGTVYGWGSRFESQDDDPTMNSYLKVETRQMQYLYGKEGAIIEDLKNGIKQPGTQAVLILIFSGIAAAVCFHGARRGGTPPSDLKMTGIFLFLAGLGWAGGTCSVEMVPIEQRIWNETRTDHFHIFSCGEPATVNRLAGRLEQFCSAYATLAGTHAIESPPIIVLAFRDPESLNPYLPRYNGRPGNVVAFFLRGKDENLIVLSLPGVGSGSAGMEVIFHEYHHLLFRHNDQLWPLWLREGMAEVYSTFQTDGHQAWIAAPVPRHMQTLHQRPLLPLSELFAVTPGSPEYNEVDRQSVFYAQSWLLTHFLMSGDNMNDRARFGQFTTLLRQGQLPVTAFTNALQVSLTAVQKDLARYLNQGVFQPIHLSLAADVSGPVTVSIRRIPSPRGRRWNPCSGRMATLISGPWRKTCAGKWNLAEH